MSGDRLSLRVLNRTLLQRQFLAERVAMPALEMVKHLVAVQAQHPNGSYVGMHARIAGFDRAELTRLIEDRQVVRSVVMRRTLHLMTAEDMAWIRSTVDGIMTATVRQPYFVEVEGMDFAELAAAGRELLGDQVLSRRKLASLLQERYPDRHAKRMADTVEMLIPLVHPAPTATWGNAWGHPAETFVAFAPLWSGVPMAEADLAKLVLRYLVAFGPASVADIQAWSGLTRLRPVVEGLRLRTYRSETGAELFDLPDAVLAEESLEAPVRFLPSFENATLGYMDRTRIMSEADRQRTARGASGGVPMYLVDGFVHGTWSIKDAVLSIQPFRPLSAAESASVQAEAERLLQFITGIAGSGDIVIAPHEN